MNSIGIQIIAGDLPISPAAQGAGYQSTATWLLDLIANRLQHGKAHELKNLSGIVLVDEIEQHLHPRWQRHIVQQLAHLLPGLQWIITTHSPLCAAGCADLNASETQLHRLHYQDARVTTHPVESLIGLKAHQILSSEAFAY